MTALIYGVEFHGSARLARGICTMLYGLDWLIYLRSARTAIPLLPRVNDLFNRRSIVGTATRIGDGSIG